MTEVAHMFWLFYNGAINTLIWSKNGFGYILGYYFVNSSGHPARELEFDKVIQKYFLKFDKVIQDFFQILTK
jgi:hypothetical protein